MRTAWHKKTREKQLNKMRLALLAALPCILFIRWFPRQKPSAHIAYSVNRNRIKVNAGSISMRLLLLLLCLCSRRRLAMWLVMLHILLFTVNIMWLCVCFFVLLHRWTVPDWCFSKCCLCPHHAQHRIDDDNHDDGDDDAAGPIIMKIAPIKAIVCVASNNKCIYPNLIEHGTMCVMN